MCSSRTSGRGAVVSSQPLVSRHLRALAVLMISASIRVAIIASGADGPARAIVLRLCLIAIIGSAVWLVATVVLHLISLSERRMLDRAANEREVRRSQTQFLLARRLVGVIFVIVGIGMVLLTFPGVEQIGAGVLASAGFLSIVAGLAAQSSLANLFAGIQLAVSGAIHLDDVDVVEGEWGHVEDVTLTYVVVRIWDERRLILPSTYFTSTPFTNWTRSNSEIAGPILFQVDWRVDIHGLRTRLTEILTGTDLWDGRNSSLVVTDATGGMLSVRVVITAASSGKLWDLQCLIREDLARWIRENNPEGLPVQRVSIESPGHRP